MSGVLENYEANIKAFHMIAPGIATMYLFFMYVFGLYNMERHKLWELIYTTFLISTCLTFGIMAICFFVREMATAYPRSVIFLSAIVYFILLSTWRTITWKLAKKGHGLRKVAIIGNKEAKVLEQKLREKYSDLYEVDIVCDENNTYLFFYLDEVEEIFITSEITEEVRERIFLFAAESEKPVFFMPKFSDINIMTARMYQTSDIATYRIDKLSLTQEEKFVKRTFDIFFAFVALLLTLPLGLIVALLVKLDKGPVFYGQERCTIRGKVFKVLKFRTMVPNAEKLSGPVLAGEDDPRITKVGRFIRMTRLDELPQLLNILKGEMSIVGPRPERPFFISQFEEEMPEYRYRLKVKSGLTGMAQVYGKYNTTAAEKLRYDLIYIKKYSLFMDFLICLKTIRILFMKESTTGV